MNIFDILGPVMVGPSSSHTAGAARIGYITRKLLGSQPKKARIGLSGSFAATGRGHGTDRALVAGLLGMKPDDMRIPDSFSVAKQEGLEFEIYNTQIKEAHPNTALLDVEGVDGKTIVVQASSLGGGRIMLNELDEITVNCTGACPTLIIRNEDSPGQVAEVTSVLYGKKVNIATLQLHRDKRGGYAVMVIETDQPVEPDTIRDLERLNGISKVTYIETEGGIADGISFIRGDSKILPGEERFVLESGPFRRYGRSICDRDGVNAVDAADVDSDEISE